MFRLDSHEWLIVVSVAALLVPVLLFPQAASRSVPTAKALKVTPDLEQRLAKWQPVRMPFNAAGLSVRERQMIEKLVRACQYLDDIYWRQSDPQGLALYKSLAASRTPRNQQLRRMLMINGGRFDLLDENRPFAGTEPMPPGRGFYPEGLTREQIEKYVQQHPEKKAEIYSPYTVVRRRGRELAGVPYHQVYKAFLDPAAQTLREAAALSDDPAFARFLQLRAAALLSDDYYESDLAWVDLEDPKFDLIFAPYETYLDDLLGVKGSYGAAVLIRDEEQSRKLAEYQKYVPEIQDALPLPPQDRPSKRGHSTPMEVMDAPFRAGDLRHGYQAVADNLPNDPRIHQAKGTKKIFFKNFMDARVNYIILPVARLLMRPDQAAKASAEGYLTFVMLHEISHGLGPAYARKQGKQADIREAIGPIFSALEEAKADVVGLFGLHWMMRQGALPTQRSEEYYASYVAGVLRSVRFGPGEAHGQAEMMEFNVLAQEKAVARDASTGRYVIDYRRMPGALERLAKELLEIEASGDRDRAENWFQRYGAMSPELKEALQAASGIPVDIDPIFSFAEPVR
ncbi:MAG TPA: Zn-dependent hydrolase [Bryobacterales bacterium]|jgi:hypothetical protein|nr:Zn-dependent hydrolase [Bryobacterales bacterium]